jgi:hypothetical protein
MTIIIPGFPLEFTLVKTGAGMTLKQDFFKDLIKKFVGVTLVTLIKYRKRGKQAFPYASGNEFFMIKLFLGRKI